MKGNHQNSKYFDNLKEIPRVAIVGGGFCGMMTAVALGESRFPVDICVFNAGHAFGRGVAFAPYSKKHLLNVPAGKMSAYSHRPGHFVDWVIRHDFFNGINDHMLVAGSYLPRSFYGDYLDDVWKEFLSAKSQNAFIRVVEGYVAGLDYDGKKYHLSANGREFDFDFVVLATGNSVPAFPFAASPEFRFSRRYFENPWSESSVKLSALKEENIVIVGNGLTMVDTVLGLMEAGFQGTVYSISPDGFTILSHRHNGAGYSKMVEELEQMKPPHTLREVVSLFNKHVKLVRKLGISAEPVVDSLRPLTQEIWKNLSHPDKEVFMSRLRHMWGVARHRLPVHVHDKIQRLRIDGRLKVIAGNIKTAADRGDHAEIRFYDKKKKSEEIIRASRVINCTGPATDILESDNLFLKHLLLKGYVDQDELKLGIKVNPDSFRIVDKKGREQERIFALGSLVKGMLWESTAVPELRIQAEGVGSEILKMISRQPEHVTRDFLQAGTTLET